MKNRHGETEDYVRNEAIARGAYEAGVKSIGCLSGEHRVRRLARIWYSMTIFTANGRRTRESCY